MTNDTTYNGYPLFNGLTNTNLQAWNRLAVYFNIISAVGMEEAKSYLQKFNDFDRQRIKGVAERVKQRGYTTVRREVLMENSKSNTVH